MIVRLARTLERDADKAANIRWECGWKYCVAFDDPGVAIGRLLADARSIDERNAHPASGEVQRYRCADNAGAQNHCICACHVQPPGQLDRYIWIAGAKSAIKGVHGRSFPSMKLMGALAAALSLVGRHGTLVAAASVFVGLAIPQLAAASKPYLGEAIVVILTLAFLRVDPDELFHHFTRPGLTAAATIWAMLAVPTVLGL